MNSTQSPAVGSTQVPDKSIAVTLADLHDRLDSLWISYLQNLHEYAESQKLMQKHMSSGFLSLARANFNAKNGLRRFGPESFHERAIASRRAKVFIDEDDQVLKVALTQWSEVEESEGGSEDSSSHERSDEQDKTQQHSGPSTPSMEPGSIDSKDTAERSTTNNSSYQNLNDNNDRDHPAPSESNSKPKSTLATDPLRWFGILVPQDLRSAQTSFIAAIKDPISKSVNAARRMREIEMEIRKLRKEIKKAEKAV